MVKNDNPSKRSWIKEIGKVISILANIAVICGIMIAYLQIRQLNKLEKTRIAIETLKQKRTDHFLKAFTRLKTIRSSDIISKYLEGEPRITLIDDLNFVMSVFDNIAFLYINDLADKSVLGNAVYSDMEEYSRMLEYVSSSYMSKSINYPKDFRENFDILLNILRHQSKEKNNI